MTPVPTSIPIKPTEGLFGKLQSISAARGLEAEAKPTAGPLLDRLQVELGKWPQADMPLVHRFTPGLYIREILMPKGALVISRIHKTEHPFTVSQGRVAVWTEEEGVVEIKAPFTGITKPGTRRVLFVFEDCIWTTYHPTELTDPEQIVEAVTLSESEARPIEMSRETLLQLMEGK